MTREEKEERQALDLLARGGARYGTRIAVMKKLKDRGLCYAHDKGPAFKKGRWTWRPTAAGWKVIEEMKATDAARREAGEVTT